MNYLGVDYGQKNIGLAIAVKGIISPIGTFPNRPNIYATILSLIEEYQITHIAIGITPSKNNPQIKKFAQSLKSRFNLDLTFVDENTTTRQAQEYLVQNQHPKSTAPDAIAAAIILSRIII